MSDISNRIEFLLTQSHQRRADLCRGTGIPEGTIRGWSKDKTPSFEAVIKIAQFFNVSLEYLATGQEPEETAGHKLSDDEQDLVDYFRLLDSRDREFLMMTARSLCSRAREEREQQQNESKIV